MTNALGYPVIAIDDGRLHYVPIGLWRNDTANFPASVLRLAYTAGDRHDASGSHGDGPSLAGPRIGVRTCYGTRFHDEENLDWARGNNFLTFAGGAVGAMCDDGSEVILVQGYTQETPGGNTTWAFFVVRNTGAGWVPMQVSAWPPGCHIAFYGQVHRLWDPATQTYPPGWFVAYGYGTDPAGGSGILALTTQDNWHNRTLQLIRAHDVAGYYEHDVTPLGPGGLGFLHVWRTDPAGGNLLFSAISPDMLTLGPTRTCSTLFGPNPPWLRAVVGGADLYCFPRVFPRVGGMTNGLLRAPIDAAEVLAAGGITGALNWERAYDAEFVTTGYSYSTEDGRYHAIAAGESWSGTDTPAAQSIVVFFPSPVPVAAPGVIRSQRARNVLRNATFANWPNGDFASGLGSGVEHVKDWAMDGLHSGVTYSAEKVAPSRAARSNLPIMPRQGALIRTTAPLYNIGWRQRWTGLDALQEFCDLPFSAGVIAEGQTSERIIPMILVDYGPWTSEEPRGHPRQEYKHNQFRGQSIPGGTWATDIAHNFYSPTLHDRKIEDPEQCWIEFRLNFTAFGNDPVVAMDTIFYAAVFCIGHELCHLEHSA